MFYFFENRKSQLLTDRNFAVISWNVEDANRIKAIFAVSGHIGRLSSNQCVIPFSIAISIHVNFVAKSTQNDGEKESKHGLD